MTTEMHIEVTKLLVGKGPGENSTFVINVSCGALNFEVKRSCSDFIELDRRIRKRYPRSDIARLVLLDTKAETRKRAHSVCQPDDLKTKTTRSRNDTNVFLFSNVNNLASMDESKVTELLVSLSNYLCSMASQHELLASDDLLLFFDQEANSMYLTAEGSNQPTVHDILLAKIASRKVIVARSEEQIRSATPGQLLIWQFSTAAYDIGFSIDVNGEVKVPYTRYASHLKTVTGTLEINNGQSLPGTSLIRMNSAIPNSPLPAAFSSTPSMTLPVMSSPIKGAIMRDCNQFDYMSPQAGTPIKTRTSPTKKPVFCSLKWDNTYALLRTKELTYKVAVVEVKEYESAKARAQELQAQAKHFELLRHQLKFEMLRVAVSLSAGVHYSSSLEHEQAILLNLQREEQLRTQAYLNKELNARDQVVEDHAYLKEQVNHLSAEIHAYEDEFDATVETLQKAEQATAAAETARDSIFTSWKFAVAQLDTAMAELKAMKSLNSSLEGDKHTMQMRITSMEQELQQQNAAHETDMLILRTEKDMQIATLSRQLRALVRKFPEAAAGAGSSGLVNNDLENLPSKRKSPSKINHKTIQSPKGKSPLSPKLQPASLNVLQGSPKIASLRSI